MDKLEFPAIGERALVQSAKLVQAGLNRPKTGDRIDLHAPGYEHPPCIWIVNKKILKIFHRLIIARQTRGVMIEFKIFGKHSFHGLQILAVGRPKQQAVHMGDAVV